jgi:hypothetical protein
LLHDAGIQSDDVLQTANRQILNVLRGGQTHGVRGVALNQRPLGHDFQ